MTTMAMINTPRTEALFDSEHRPADLRLVTRYGVRVVRFLHLRHARRVSGEILFHLGDPAERGLHIYAAGLCRRLRRASLRALISALWRPGRPQHIALFVMTLMSGTLFSSACCPVMRVGAGGTGAVDRTAPRAGLALGGEYGGVGDRRRRYAMLPALPRAALHLLTRPPPRLACSWRCF